TMMTEQEKRDLAADKVHSADRGAAVTRQRLGSKRPKFTILIGSRARSTQNSASDIDVVRIGHKRSVKLHNRGRKRHISYVDYDPDAFLNLYKGGSLFLYH